MSRKNDVRDAAAESTHTAAERGAAILEQVLEAIQPLLNTASEKAQDARHQVQPYANVAKDRLSPVADQAKDKAGQAKGKLAPLAATAAVGSIGLANKTKDQLQPHLENLADKVQPAVEQARDKVQDDLVPQLVELLHQAEQHPAVSEASRRGQAAAAALRGDLSLPEKKKRNVGSAVAKTAAVTALLAAAAVAVRQFLGSKDDAWTAHQPSQAYVPNQDQKLDDAEVDAPRTQPVADAKPAAQTAPATQGTPMKDSAPLQDAKPIQDTKPIPTAPAGTTPVESVQPVENLQSTAPGAPEVRRDVTFEPDPHEKMSAEGGPVRGAETTNEDLAALNTYGEGSYVGDEPPSNFIVKGNERSMKFHTPDSAGYERTIADVWFVSPEAAEQAGFSRAQR